MKALTKIKKRVVSSGTLPSIDIDLAAFLPKGDDDTKIAFREPGSNDLFPASKRKTQFKLNHPDMSDTLTGQVLILASCYIPSDDDEPNVNVDEIIADIAINHRDMFMHMVAKFSEAYPMSGISSDEAGNG